MPYPSPAMQQTQPVSLLAPLPHFSLKAHTELSELLDLFPSRKLGILVLPTVEKAMEIRERDHLLHLF